MKLKIYRISLFICLFLIAGLTIFAIVRSIILFSSIKNTADAVMYIVALFVLLAFIGLEIGNTFVSLKQGSTFAKALAFDNDGTLNKKGLVIFSLMGLACLAAVIYFLLLLCGLNLYFAFFAKPMQYVIFLVFLTGFINALFILLFPLLGREDPSLRKTGSVE